MTAPKPGASPKPCPSCGEADHADLKIALNAVEEDFDCNERVKGLIVHACDYIGHLEAQLASLPALVEALDLIVRAIENGEPVGRHSGMMNKARAALALVEDR